MYLASVWVWRPPCGFTQYLNCNIYIAIFTLQYLHCNIYIFSQLWMFPPSTIFRRQPTFAFWQPMLPPRKSSSSSGSGELPKYGSICAKYFHASYQVSHSGPNQSLFLPLLLGSASIQESIIFPVTTIINVWYVWKSGMRTGGSIAWRSRAPGMRLVL